MKQPLIPLVLFTAALLWGGAVPAAPAADTAAPAMAAKARPTPPATQVVRIKAVDINTASAAQLLKLPGVGAAEAKRIIARRPYCSKAALATEHVVDDALYGRIHALIEAGFPYKDVAKNVAWCSGKKK